MNQNGQKNMEQDKKVKVTVNELRKLQQQCEEESLKRKSPERKAFYEGMAIAYSTIEQQIKGNTDYVHPEFIEHLFDSMTKLEDLPPVEDSYAENCSFCGTNKSEAGALALGPGVSICKKCLEFGKDVIQSYSRQDLKNSSAAHASYMENCSFCQKSSETAGTLTLGPGVSICEGCLEFGKNVI
ncbi:ClpX C4-type zinc finger protein [Domibacillus robiginosus]|uniref:ClpX C4-type zinc finger protein n=1 Tax=Domibacillus robiginosus TaxID=1071054 RepID=UPI00067AA679|nr:ClpX C4-type zinc finger protein [Domibacillus robiginosus]